ncbi:EamA domain [Dillenia turbinata]|uniref:EamA domain n=1 Tax=Dillenia turbinata TaxID=194707 RepID=A0AAN8VJY7_9MAGN
MPFSQLGLKQAGPIMPASIRLVIRPKPSHKGRQSFPTSYCHPCSDLHLRSRRSSRKMSNMGTVTVMVATECLQQGLSTLSKVALTRGMSPYVYIVYSDALVVLLLFLASLFHYRKKSYPRVNFSVLSQIFLLGILGCGTQISMIAGIKYSSPTLAAVMADLTPAFTFILAIFFGMEKLDLRVRSSQAKFLGTILSIIGAFVVTLYKGQPIMFATLPSSKSTHEHPQSVQSDWLIGGTLLAFGGFSVSLLIIIQAWIMKEYPHVLVMSLLGYFCVSILSTLVSIFLETEPEAWNLGLDMSLVAVIYSAIFVTAFRSVVHAWAMVVHAWVIHLKGPVFVTMFRPLGIVIAVVMGVTVLGDTLYGGSVLGAAIIAIGFYSVIWGQSKQEKYQEHKTFGLESSANKVGLLLRKTINGEEVGI